MRAATKTPARTIAKPSTKGASKAAAKTQMQAEVDELTIATAAKKRLRKKQRECHR